MSLDVHLLSDELVERSRGSGIFVREDGQTKEISEEEWRKRYPDRDPVRYQPDEDETRVLYSANITHNLSQMAKPAFIYEALWRPEEKGWTKASDIIKPLEDGLEKLKTFPDSFKKLNPSNGWGNYDNLVEFVEKYLEACKQYPDATIEVSR